MFTLKQSTVCDQINRDSTQIFVFSILNYFFEKTCNYLCDIVEGIIVTKDLILSLIAVVVRCNECFFPCPKNI